MQKYACFCLLLALMVQPPFAPLSGSDSQKSALFAELLEANIHPDDLALIESHLNDFSIEQLTEIERFLTDSGTIADSRWFDVSAYLSWDEYNFYRPTGDTILSILARRDLFLDPARQLNNRSLTNMSPEALAALAFSQVYVEEKWDHEPPWDGDANSLFNWVHPALTDDPNIFLFLRGDFLYNARVEYWWATYWSLPLRFLYRLGIGRGSDVEAALSDMQPPNANAPRLAGYAFPVGNQLYLQTAETVYWYADYRHVVAIRYGTFEPQPLDTRIRFPAAPLEMTLSQSLPASASSSDPELRVLFNAPFGAALRTELTHPESAAFWNAMRFVHAGARQREGGASPEHPENGQPAVFALRYAERTAFPVGRRQEQVSAFALLTTVYSDSILLDFTNWDSASQTLIHVPSDEARSDGLHRQVSERNKAILVIEQMGNELAYPNATHVSGSRGLGFDLMTQYDDPVNGDFLPYTPEEAQALVLALLTEARDYGIESSRVSLCNSPLLKSGYEAYASLSNREGSSVPTWDALIGGICA